jgi:hypothetical protein
VSLCSVLTVHHGSQCHDHQDRQVTTPHLHLLHAVYLEASLRHGDVYERALLALFP